MSATSPPGQTFSGLVSFADGQTSQTITLNVQGDLNPEGDDAFTVTLSNAVGGTIADGTATGTIVNDDGSPPLLAINDVTVTEGDSGSSLMTFTITRTGGTGALDVDFQTSDGSASSAVGPGQDYVSTSGTVHFNAGQMTATLSVPIIGDTNSETSETLLVTLSNATNFALITDGVGVGTIAGDDPIYIHDIQGTSYYSPILGGGGDQRLQHRLGGLRHRPRRGHRGRQCRHRARVIISAKKSPTGTATATPPRASS